ncbi:MAG: hypothetical protein EB102_10315 [Gammaproteobacteria bacterium]|jgi:hypothetical protein|nr:hypothetical protein [Gammaproteobacteria bacterium]NBR17736.1 hypothetical protein [Gammaproteobacteria bacterium]NDA42807.1 hypothetical protein [Gammaproteobacteria bacterium]NDB17273.1 hypothetical protein [Gammaproteobacteria bacterium]NDF86891.1 hypothetical protein [Gammaproteobacteria bacterium]
MSHGRVTPQLRHWIVKQIEAGQSPESVLESMIRNGWPEGTALDVMERTLRMRVAQIKAAENAAAQATPANDPPPASEA